MDIKPYIITPALFIFRLINTSNACFTRIISFKNKLLSFFNLLINEQKYKFINDSVYPYDNTYKIEKSSLIYNVDKKIFYNSTSLLFFEIGTPIPIPILSLEIVNKKGITLYDLTDFIESMRYIKLSDKYKKPSVGHIISVWQLDSKIILDDNEVSVQYIDTQGNTVETSIRNNLSIY